MRFIEEESIDVAILSDPYRICHNNCDKLSDTDTQRAAIIIPGKRVFVGNIICDAEFVSERVAGYQI